MGYELGDMRMIFELLTTLFISSLNTFSSYTCLLLKSKTRNHNQRNRIASQ